MKQNKLKVLFIKLVELGIIGPINLLLKNLKKTLRPRWLVFEITDRCNSRCTHCNIWEQKPIKNFLTPQDIKKIFKSSLFAKLKHVILTGGEAILRNDLEEIILIIHKILPKVEFTLSTNGLLPDQVLALVKSMAEKNIRVIVGVSIDALGEKHDSIRGVKGNFEKVDYLIRELMNLKEKYGDIVSPALGFTLSDLTVDFVKDIVEYSSKLGTDFVVAMYEEASYYHNVGKKLVNNQRLIKALKMMPATLHRDILIKALKKQNTKFSCFSLNTFCVLRCNGDIVPCLRLSHMSIGNIKESDPLEVWQSTDAQKIRKTVKSCSDCLNTWAIDWSLRSYGWPVLKYALKKRIKRIYGRKD